MEGQREKQSGEDMKLLASLICKKEEGWGGRAPVAQRTHKVGLVPLEGTGT